MISEYYLNRFDKKFKDENFICIPILSDEKDYMVDNYINYYREKGLIKDIKEYMLVGEIWITLFEE